MSYHDPGTLFSGSDGPFTEKSAGRNLLQRVGGRAGTAAPQGAVCELPNPVVFRYQLFCEPHDFLRWESNRNERHRACIRKDAVDWACLKSVSCGHQAIQRSSWVMCCADS